MKLIPTSYILICISLTIYKTVLLMFPLLLKKIETTRKIYFGSQILRVQSTVTWTHELRHNIIAKGIWGKGKHLTFSMTGKQRKKKYVL